MNIFRPQVPYVFHPPKYSPVLAPFILWLSERFYLRKKFRIRAFQVEGGERLSELNKQGHSLLIAPNHADHVDPHALLVAGKRYGLRFHFMAAREGFESQAVNAFFLQRMGAFSVDREGADLAAVKTAMSIIQQGRHPLVIFPEGEIWHHQETLNELNEGVATIVLRAAAKLAEGKKCYVVPTGLRYCYDDSIADSFCRRLSVLEERITWKPRPEREVMERIYRLGGGLLAIKEEEFLGQAQTGTLVERLQGLQIKLVESVETRYGVEGSGRLPVRVKTLRGKIRKELTGESPPDVARERELYDELDTLFVAVQIYSYPGIYLAEEPSHDRIAETLYKLEEDVLGESAHHSDRSGTVRFGEPVEVGEFLAARELTCKTGVAPLTALLSEEIQKLIG